jgi:hypothetical protein
MDALAEFEGTVAPTFMSQGRNQGADFLHGLPLRLGRVMRVHAPQDATNVSKRFHEYDVLVDAAGENAVATRYMVPHCLVMSAFGGLADFSTWTPRVSEVGAGEQTNYGSGSRVLILLINGSSFGGVIVGGVRASDFNGVTDQSLVDKKADGHQFTSQFNGVRAQVFDDGAFQLSVKGATDAKGALRDASFSTKSGTNILFRDGAVDLEVKDRYEITADGEFSWRSNSTTLLQSQGEIKILSDLGNVVVETTSAPAGEVLLKSPFKVRTDSAFVQLGVGTDQMVKGTTYRLAEATLNATEMSARVAAAVAWAVLAPFAIVLDPTGTLTSFCAAAAGADGAAAGALGTFEAGSPGYLSLKNSLD